MSPPVHNDSALLVLLRIFSETTLVLVWFGIPLLIIYRQPKRGARVLPGRFGLAIIATWLGLVVHRCLLGMPVSRALAESRGDAAYDGVGGNAGFVMFGWGFGLVGAATALLAFKAGELVRARRKPPQVS
jgi:hypothetical protein